MLEKIPIDTLNEEEVSEFLSNGFDEDIASGRQVAKSYLNDVKVDKMIWKNNGVIVCKMINMPTMYFYP